MNRRVIKTFALICLLYFVSRAGIYLASYTGYNIFSRYNEAPSYKTEEQAPNSQSRMELPVMIYDTYVPRAGDFIKFDSGYYIKIAREGYDRYRMSEEHPAADWPFFPLYPALMKLVSFILPIRMTWIGFLLSNGFAVLSLYFVYRIAEEISGDLETAWRSVIYLLIFPTSLYLSIIYTESLFLFLSSLCVYLLLKRKIGWSLFVASLSTVTRIPGIANLMIIGFFLLREAGYNPLKIRLKYYGGFLASAIPLLSFFTYMYFLTGDFFAVFHELSLNWGRTTSTPFIGYFRYFTTPFFVSPAGWDFSFASFLFTTVLLILYIVYMACYRKHMDLFLYGLVLMLIPLSSASFAFTSVLRYYIASFPLFIFMGIMGTKNRILDFSFTVLLFSFHVIYTIAFFNNYTFVV